MADGQDARATNGFFEHPQGCGLTARQFFVLVPEVGFSLEGQTRGSAPTGKAVR